MRSCQTIAHAPLMKTERQLEAWFEFGVKTRGAGARAMCPTSLLLCVCCRANLSSHRPSTERLSYPCVVAAGNNANTLHYITNWQLLGENDLVLMDAGCEFRMYSSDISRTFPVSGKFTQAQREVYEVVLAAHRGCIKVTGAEQISLSLISLPLSVSVICLNQGRTDLSLSLSLSVLYLIQGRAERSLSLAVYSRAASCVGIREESLSVSLSVSVSYHLRVCLISESDKGETAHISSRLCPLCVQQREVMQRERESYTQRERKNKRKRERETTRPPRFSSPRAEQKVHPGIPKKEIHEASVAMLTSGLRKLGIPCQDPAAYYRYYPHHIGHFLGIDVHDASKVADNRPLRPGMILTIEPGLYFRQDDTTVPPQLRRAVS